MLVSQLGHIQERIHIATKAARRQVQDVTLLAVSKAQPSSKIIAAYDAGQKKFAESYLQESLIKIQELQHLNIEWHFIGTIQSNKTRKIASHFHWIHSVENVKIARRLSEQRPDDLNPANICLQVNLFSETSKQGFTQETLFNELETILTFPNIQVRGLMAIPPKQSDYSKQLAQFTHIAEVFKQCQSIAPQMDTLSMGMSDDFEAAIAAGSTQVRVGSALFGPRTHPQSQNLNSR